MNLKEIEEKLAKNVYERSALFLEKRKIEEHERERIFMNERRERAKQQAQIDHEAYLLEQQRLQDQKEYEKSDIGRIERAKREARESIQREIAMGLTPAEREFKHLDWQGRLDYQNAKANGECTDIEDFLKKRRQKEEQRERRRRKLKGL